MGLKEVFSYYGRLDVKPNRPLVDDLLIERKKVMLQELKETEDRIKRHITECKREVIKEIKNIFTDPKPKSQIKKGSADVK